VHRVSSKVLNAGLERLREWAELHQGLLYAFRKRVTQNTARYVVQPRQSQPVTPAPTAPVVSRAELAADLKWLIAAESAEALRLGTTPAPAQLVTPAPDDEPLPF